jgi:hypothetical protein
VIKVCTTLPDSTEICTSIDLAHDAASRAYTTTVGNGSNTSFTIHHNLDSLEVLPIIRDKATGVLNTDATVTVLDADSVHVDFDTAPTTGQYAVTLLAVTPSV